jgi:GNAT superfamily N-acetyltransferase
MTEDKLDIQIRMASPADAPSIASVLYESFIEYKALYTDEAFAATAPASEQIQNRMSEGPIWVAVRDDAIVGTMSAVSRSGSLYIRGMAVIPSARGLGIGESLLKQVENFDSSHSYKRVILSTTPFLARAIRLYERMGFRRSDKGPHDLCGTPLFAMEKRVEPSVE